MLWRTFGWNENLHNSNLLLTHFGLLTFNTCLWQYLPAPMNLAAESMSLFAVVVVKALLVCKYEIKPKSKWRKVLRKTIQEFIIYLLGEDDSRSLPSWQAAPGDGDTGDLRHLDQFGSHYFDARKLTKDFRSVLFKSTASQNVWRGL